MLYVVVWLENPTEEYPDGATVTEEKLVIFLMEEVIPRGHLTKENTAIGLATIEGHVNAAVDLYNYQKKTGCNDHPSPRGHNIRDVLNYYKTCEAQRMKEGMVNRSDCRLDDGYTEEQKTKLCRTWLTSGSYESLRTHADFLLGHSSLARGDTKRLLQYADMFTTILPGEGPTECRAVVIVSRESKTNKSGQRQYNAAIRSKDPVCCAVGAVALYLFHKWQGGGTGTQHEFPSFDHPRSWYNLYFLTASDSGKPMSYTTQARHLKNVLVSVGVESSKVTHITRGSGARLAEAAGADESDIRRTGHWNEDTMEKTYLGKLARGTMRALAGYPPQGGGFWIPRATIEPSEKLKETIFPEVESWITDLQSRENTDKAALAFLEMLQFLRIVLLQDAPVLIDLFPQSSAWNHPVFASLDFVEFKTKVLAAEKEAVDPAANSLRHVLPDLARLMETGFHGMNFRMTAMTAQLGSIDQRLSSLEGLMEHVSIHPTQSDQPASSHVVTMADPRETETPASGRCTAPVIHQYSLDRNLSDVESVWREFALGLPGRPAVRLLEATYKNKWRSNDAESRFYRKRRELYHAVTTIAKARKITSFGAARLLDEYACAESLTLDKLRIQLEEATRRLTEVTPTKSEATAAAHLETEATVETHMETNQRGIYIYLAFLCASRVEAGAESTWEE
ncbi:hypothetical protein BBJ28_00022643 [Nothophytophthora sp. Chile5]|nr:hypothetical protein BBJ28_00022643 [Nothophytophthora sp. Chile5]